MRGCDVMKFRGSLLSVVNGSRQMLAEDSRKTQKAGENGWWPLRPPPDLGPAFHAYAAGGPGMDH